MAKKTTSIDPTCSECGARNCARRDQKFPAFCLTESTDPKQLNGIVRTLRGNSLDARLARGQGGGA